MSEDVRSDVFGDGTQDGITPAEESPVIDESKAQVETISDQQPDGDLTTPEPDKPVAQEPVQPEGFYQNNHKEVLAKLKHEAPKMYDEVKGTQPQPAQPDTPAPQVLTPPYAVMVWACTGWSAKPESPLTVSGISR